MQRRNDMGDYRAPPVNVGDELDVRIEAVGEKGDGIAKKGGFVIFIPSVKENDEVRIKITKVLRQVGFGEVIGKAEGPIGSVSTSKPVREARHAPKQEETFEYDESKDSEDFGDEPEESESSAEEPDDLDEEKKD